MNDAAATLMPKSRNGMRAWEVSGMQQESGTCRDAQTPPTTAAATTGRTRARSSGNRRPRHPSSSPSAVTRSTSRTTSVSRPRESTVVAVRSSPSKAARPRATMTKAGHAGTLTPSARQGMGLSVRRPNSVPTPRRPWNAAVTLTGARAGPKSPNGVSGMPQASQPRCAAITPSQ